MRSRPLRLLAALWALQSATAGAPTNTTPALCQDPTACDADAGAPENGSATAARVAVLLPGEMRFPDFDNLAASLAAFDVFVSTYAEDEDRARLLRPKGLVLTDRSTVSLPGGKGRMYQWYHLDRLLREYKAELLAYDVLFRTRTDAHFFETMTPAHLSVGDDALHAAIDHGFYARPATFYRVYEDMFAAARGPYLDQGHAYFPLDYENLVRAYRLDAANAAHVRMVKRHPTLAYRYKRVNVVEAASFLVYPTSVYNRDTDKLIRNIERHLRANLTIDNGIYTNKNRGNRVFSSEKFHMVHALSRARFADFAAPTVGVLLGNRPTPKTCPRPTPHAALLQAWWDALAKEESEDMCFPPARSPRPRAPRKRKQDSCPRPTPNDALLRTWRNALADLPDDMSERPREKRRRTPPQTRPNKRRENKRRQDVYPRATPDDALLDAWRDALAQKVPEGVCKHPRPKSAARLAQETIHRKFGRADLADKRRHADRVAAKANLYARGARIRTEATGGK